MVEFFSSFNINLRYGHISIKSSLQDKGFFSLIYLIIVVGVDFLADIFPSSLEFCTSRGVFADFVIDWSLGWFLHFCSQSNCIRTNNFISNQLTIRCFIIIFFFTKSCEDLSSNIWSTAYLWGVITNLELVSRALVFVAWCISRSSASLRRVQVSTAFSSSISRCEDVITFLICSSLILLFARFFFSNYLSDWVHQYWQTWH